ncbi:Alpha/Beta hydrolase protein [Amylocarpus encephaloides]|uniref:Carboxylic ester hydrolase n=1 Tax=Amylocarpus encephaloides TaxID=45428 RepID=A0A9P7YSD5_9HELO|nr:Alpha/Beta hydrolase protein [Amylocarpus encephaloides]
MLLIPLAVLGVLVFDLAHQSHAADDHLVDLGYSKYNGVARNGINTWWGIRYAAPPLRDLRFKAPQDPSHNDAIQQADTHGAVCHPSPSTSLNTGFNEDCLFLDVYAPAADNKLHPVFIWLQGGGLNGLADTRSDGTSLINAADKDMVVVTFNYRVGLYGFLASREVQANGDSNAGLLDQRKLLHWVQKYIHLFGGDPSRVTLGGASAGAGSVSLHLTAYGGRDDKLFHAVTAESPSYGVQYTIAEAQYQYDALVQRVDCDKAPDTLKCLRALPVKILAENNPNLPTPGGTGGTPVFMWSNVVDGTFTQGFSYDLYAQGKFVKVPAIFGSTTNEGTGAAPRSLENAGQMNSFLKNNFPKLTQAHLTKIDSLYPDPPNDLIFPGAGEYWRPASNAYGNMRYNCPSLFMSGSFPRIGGSNATWNYHWDVLRPGDATSGDGVGHVAEQSSVWGTPGPTEKPIAPTIQAYWASFIRTHNPNTLKLAGSPEWVEYMDGDPTRGAMQRMHFPNDVKKIGMETVAPGLREKCSFWLSVGSTIGQ